jgi:UDP-GlcNAc:undecaprenyl-phosphate GlcNAc-1-phosphate transferase
MIDVFIIPFFIVLMIVPLISYLAIKLDLVDHPASRKIHKKPIPRIGGIGIYLGFIGALAYSGYALKIFQKPETVFPILVGATLVMFLGLWDDIKRVPAPVKLLGQLLIAFYTVHAGIKVDFITNPLGGILPLGMFSMILSMVWIIAMMNMMNLIDGLDGLAAGLASISGFILFLAAVILGRFDAAILALCFIGATTGFLRHNFHPASIFMGDCGSLLLGYLLAVISIVGVMKSTATIAVAIPILALIVPISDTGMAIIRRLKAGIHIFHPDDGHLHHKLLYRGFNQKQVAMILYYSTVAFGLLGLSFAFVDGLWAILWLALVVTLILFVIKRISLLNEKKL